MAKQEAAKVEPKVEPKAEPKKKQAKQVEKTPINKDLQKRKYKNNKNNCNKSNPI
jgi:hypothetical protein